MLVYSIGSRTSFDKLKLINEKLLNMLGSKPPRVLVGSMSDLEKGRQVLNLRCSLRLLLLLLVVWLSY